MIPQWELRAAFARSLSEMYGREVPAYTTLLRVSAEVNADVMAKDGERAQRLGRMDRVTAERHGAIRVGTRAELRDVGQVFVAFGMHPVGFYDLRDASASSVPVVSTAFRPREADELARNPFRVFTSLLVTEDRRFFDADLQQRLEAFLGRRRLFPPRVLELAARSEANGGLEPADADELVRGATACFALSKEPIDRAWYEELSRVSAVAADIGGVSSTHINHLTPRVLDIDELYRRMSDLGIEMIDEIQGPPAWEGPDVLLRQTSFRALAEPRGFTDGAGTLRVRFGEVEARGIALTAAGRSRYDQLLTDVDRRVVTSGRSRVAPAGRLREAVAAEVWREGMPRTEEELDRAGLGAFTYRSSAGRGRPSGSVHDLVAAGHAVREPIVYEDFLPRSAAGIFQSNLTEAGSRDDAAAGAHRDASWLAGALGRDVTDPIVQCAEQTSASLRALATELNLTEIPK